MSERELREWYSIQDWCHCSSVLGGPGTCAQCDKEVASLAAFATKIRRDALVEAAELVERESHVAGAQGYSGGPKHTDYTMTASRIRALAESPR